MAGFVPPFLLPLDPRWDNSQHVDPRLDGEPRLTPDARRPWKPGQSKGAFIWPRDKKMGGTPLRSKQRWKDLLNGKGPAIFAGNRTKYGPTRNTWSNWNDWWLNTLGYQDDSAECLTSPAQWKGKKYDFQTRKYTTNWNHPAVWSDVKYGIGGFPVYWRDWRGNERTLRQPELPHWLRVANDPLLQEQLQAEGRINDFAYNPNTEFFDWQRPEPAEEWQFWLDLN